MFSTRLRPSEKIIDYLLIYDISDSSKGCQLEYYYPLNLPNVEAEAQSLKAFVFPCSHKNTLSEEYTLIFTDIDGKLDFVSCVCLPTSGYIVCLRSRHPWFELFHNILLAVNQKQLYSHHLRPMLGPLIDRLSIVDDHVELPVCPGGPILPIAIPIPEPSSHPFYHRYILEYYNTLSISNWIVVFESLLLEKSVIFYSNRFQRISSCALASVSLLYPLTWVHLIYPLLPLTCVDILGCPSPFVAGIHSCAIEKVKQVLNNGVRLVDLDNDVVYISGSSEERLPSAMRQWLLRRCFSSHHSILRRKRTTQVAAAASLIEPFLEAMVILLGGYREAMTKGNPIAAKSTTPELATSSSDWKFDANVFVTTRGRECQPYLRELLHSQMVHQFIESRLAKLNSDLGMVEQDDFEDCISRFPGLARSNLSDLLDRGRRGFGRLAKRIAKVKLTRREKKRAESLPQNKLSSESSSSELDLPKVPEPDSLPKPHNLRRSSSPRRVSGWQAYTPPGTDAQLNIPRAERSLLSTILDDVPELPPDWQRSGSSLVAPQTKPEVRPRPMQPELEPEPVVPVEAPTKGIADITLDVPREFEEHSSNSTDGSSGNIRSVSP